MWLCVSTRFHRTLPRPGATIGCLADNSANAIGCASGVLSGSAGTFAKCVGGEHTADKWTSCAASANSDFARARNIATCVNPNKAACAAQYVGGDGAAFAACMAGGNDKLETYLAAANPALADAQKTFSCVSKILRRHAGLRLLGASTWRRRFAYSRLRRESDKGAAALCLLGDKPEVRAAQRLQMHREWKLRQQPHRKLLGRHS